MEDLSYSLFVMLVNFMEKLERSYDPIQGELIYPILEKLLR